jgi:hypothetical protein
MYISNQIICDNINMWKIEIYVQWRRFNWCTKTKHGLCICIMMFFVVNQHYDHKDFYRIFEASYLYTRPLKCMHNNKTWPNIFIVIYIGRLYTYICMHTTFKVYVRIKTKHGLLFTLSINIIWSVFFFITF